jgi:hypothetical protein
MLALPTKVNRDHHQITGLDQAGELDRTCHSKLMGCTARVAELTFRCGNRVINSRGDLARDEGRPQASVNNAAPRREMPRRPGNFIGCHLAFPFWPAAGIGSETLMTRAYATVGPGNGAMAQRDASNPHLRFEAILIVCSAMLAGVIGLMIFL